MVLPKAANSQVTVKKRKKTSGSWKPGQSGNPNGRPKDGESLTAILAQQLSMTAEQLSEVFGNNDLGRAYKQMPKRVMMNWSIIGRILAAIMFDPQASLVKEILDRMDGKVADSLNLGGKVDVEGLTEILRKAYGTSKGE